MDGIHDMGGMDGFGPVEPEPGEPVFHERWEGRVLAMARAMSYVGAWGTDSVRSAMERIPPGDYLASSYYRRRLLGMEKDVIERGLAGADELAIGHALRPGPALRRKLDAASVPVACGRGWFERSAGAPARFAVGDRVRATNIHPATHTRLPRYARGRVGTVERVHGCHVFPDAAVLGSDEDPRWLYTVRFDGRELWGAGTSPTVSVSVDAFEPYLESA